jgi:hypothetical protein
VDLHRDHAVLDVDERVFDGLGQVLADGFVERDVR